MNRNRIKLYRNRKFRGIIFGALLALIILPMMAPASGFAATELTSGVPMEGAFEQIIYGWPPVIVTERWHFYEITTLPNTTEISVDLTPNKVDFFAFMGELYVRQSAEPSRALYDCRSYMNLEVGGPDTDWVNTFKSSCTLSSSGVTTWYMGVRWIRDTRTTYSIVATLINDDNPPTVPTNLQGSSSSTTQIDLTWDSASDVGDSGVAGYHVYRDSTLVGTTSNTNYSDTGLAQGTQYAYQVSAFDGVGNESALCAAIQITTRTPSSGDSDGDGMLDTWEIQYFGDLSHGPDDHDDGDGVTNYNEYLLDSNPTVDDLPGTGINIIYDEYGRITSIYRIPN